MERMDATFALGEAHDRGSFNFSGLYFPRKGSAGLHIQWLRDDHCGDNAVYSDIAALALSLSTFLSCIGPGGWSFGP
jgi:hypothetical protein